MPPKKTLGQIAYEKFIEDQDNILGVRYAPWSRLSPKLKKRWEDAGQAVGAAVIHMYQLRYVRDMPLFHNPPQPDDIASLTY